MKRVNLRTTLPVEGLDGDYQLLVKVDATDLVTEELGEQILEDNNSTLTSIDDAINVSPGYRDLASAIGSRIKLPDQVVAGDGTKLTVPLEITNLGNIAIERGTKIAVDIIATPTAGGDEITVDRIENVSISNLRPGKMKRVNLSTRLLPAGLDGNYQLLLKADSTDIVLEELREQVLEENNEALTPEDQIILVSPHA